MSENAAQNGRDVAPGFMDEPGRSIRDGLLTYATGLALAAVLTAGSFYLVRTGLIWGPGIIMALVALAIAQIGVHLVFFLHLTTAPDNTNNSLAIAFGLLIVTLVVGGSLWIMAHLDHNLMPDEAIARADLETLATEGVVRVDGVVAATEPEKVRANISGVVAAVGCNTGAHVEANELCAEIDAQPYLAAVNQQTQALHAARSRLEIEVGRLDAVSVALRRESARAGARVLARLRRAAETLRRRVDHATGDVRTAQSALVVARDRLAQTRIASPIKGTIQARNIEVGDHVSPISKTPLFVIVPDTARVTAIVDDAQAGRIAVGDEAILTLDSLPAQVFHGTVTRIERARKTREAVVDIVASDRRHALASGMVAQARISVR